MAPLRPQLIWGFFMHGCELLGAPRRVRLDAVFCWARLLVYRSAQPTSHSETFVINSHLVLSAVLMSLVSLSAIAYGAERRSKSGKYWVYVGTYTGPESKGIHLVEFDAQSGDLQYNGVAAETREPDLRMHRSGLQEPVRRERGVRRSRRKCRARMPSTLPPAS